VRSDLGLESRVFRRRLALLALMLGFLARLAYMLWLVVVRVGGDPQVITDRISKHRFDLVRGPLTTTKGA
jgi:hypothetical protein